MFEIGIICVIFLAVAYWAVLWLMGRREDAVASLSKRAACRGACAPCVPEGPVLSARSERPVEAIPAQQPPFRQERLESLLNTIKQDLNQLVQK
jgi:hypothetical protein